MSIDTIIKYTIIILPSNGLQNTINIVINMIVNILGNIVLNKLNIILFKELLIKTKDVIIPPISTSLKFFLILSIVSVYNNLDISIILVQGFFQNIFSIFYSNILKKRENNIIILIYLNFVFFPFCRKIIPLHNKKEKFRLDYKTIKKMNK